MAKGGGLGLWGYVQKHVPSAAGIQIVAQGRSQAGLPHAGQQELKPESQ